MEEACQSWGAIITAAYACYHGVVSGWDIISIFMGVITFSYVGAIVIGGALILFCSFFIMLKEMFF